MSQKILSITKLSILLGIPREVLEDVATNKKAYYRPFTKKETKKDGSIKERKIDNPNKAIRQIQRRINKRILQPICDELPEYMTGCITGRSIKNNAAPHQRGEAILAVDITNCFPNISSSSVYAIYRNRLGCSPPCQPLTFCNTLSKLFSCFVSDCVWFLSRAA